MKKYYYKSPFGFMEIGVEGSVLVSLTFTEQVVMSENKSNFAEEIKKQLSEYFEGKRKRFDISIDVSGTEFQKKVWRELLKIPYGQTLSYQEIAEKIGNKNSHRAVGNACNKNPILIIIPCHRVISKAGKLTGYAYGLKIKKDLLKLEST